MSNVVFDESEVEPIITGPQSDVITFDESEVQPIVAAATPSPYDTVLADTTAPSTPDGDDSGSAAVMLHESEVAPITAARPSAYGSVVVFDESEVEPVVGRRAPGYTGVVIFDDAEVKPIGPPPPRGYDGVTVFEERAAEPVAAEPRSSPYRVVAFSDTEVEPIVGERKPGPGYLRVLEALGYLAPKRQSAPFHGETPLGPSGSPLTRGRLSFELDDAWDLPAPRDILADTRAEQQTVAWLRTHLPDIVEAERKFKVDRRAIAAAIAWEALENVKPGIEQLRSRGLFGPSIGPGKVHVDSDAVREIERDGYVPARDEFARRRLLSTPRGAIEYIGAIMAAHADVAEVHGYDIRRDPLILTNEYHGRSPSAFDRNLTEKQVKAAREGRVHIPVPGNPMAIWTARRMHYLEKAVGVPDPAVLPGFTIPAAPPD